MEENLGNQVIYYDSTKELMSMFIKFDQISINMIKSKSLKEFDHWSHKCYNLDRRCTLLFLRKYIDRIPDDYIFYSELYLNEKIDNSEKLEEENKIMENRNNTKSVEIYELKDKEKYSKKGIRLKWKK